MSQGFVSQGTVSQRYSFFRRQMLLLLILLVLAALLGCMGSTEQQTEPGSVVALPPPEQPPPEVLPTATPVPTPAAQSTPTQEAVAARPKPLRITMSDCWEVGCRLHFTFDQQMAEHGKLKEAPIPKQSFSPRVAGSLAWSSPWVLAFTPAKNALLWGKEVRVTITEAVPLGATKNALPGPWVGSFTVPYLQVAGKVASWPVVMGRPRLISLLNSNCGLIGAGPAFALYDQPVYPELVEQHLQVTDKDGKRLAAEADNPESVRRVLDAGIDTRLVVAITVPELPADGELVYLHLPDWKEPGKQPELFTYDLEVSTTLSVESFAEVHGREDDRVPLEASWQLMFNNQVDLSRFRASLHLSPEPDSLTVTRVWNGAIAITATLEPGVAYRITTDPELTDIIGNHLAKPFDVVAHAQDLPPVLSLPQQPMLVERQRQRLPVRVRNLGELRIAVHRFETPERFARALTAGQRTHCADLGAGKESEQTLPELQRRMNLIETFNLPVEGQPGLLCLEVWAEGRGSEVEREGSQELQGTVLLQSSDLGITSKVFPGTVLAWITRLDNAAPVSGAMVQLLDQAGTQIAEGTADRSGVVVLPAKGVTSRTGITQPLYLVASGGSDRSVARLQDDQLSHPYQFGLAGEVRDSERLNAVLFTERGVYRPGDTVHLKVITEAAVDRNQVRLTIQDPRGQQLTRQELSLDDLGTADLDLALKEQAAVGEYVIRLQRGQAVATRSFLVEEYRVPTFRVSIEGVDSSDVWRCGDEVNATVKAEYLHGGLLDGRQVQWQVWRVPQPFAPAAFPGFVFNLGDPDTLRGAVSSGSGRLNSEGRLPVSFRAQHPSSAGPMRYVLEASVTDVDRQVYAGRVSKVVHPAAFVIGVRPPTRRVLEEAETVEVAIVALTPDGKPLAGVPVRAQLELIEYHTTARLASGSTVQVLNRPVEEEQQQCLVTTAETAVSCSFTLAAAGEYRIRAWAQDTEHRAVQAGFSIGAVGDNPAAWPRFDQDRIEVVADKQHYRAGDTARLLVQSPFSSAQGLLTIERNQVLEHRTFSISDDTPAIEVPIRAEHAPNVFVSVILLRGRTHDLRDASGFETGAPGFKMGYVKLAVEPGEQRLAVTLTPSATIAAPGQTISVDLQVRDSAGAPRGGQATVFAVDEAVLGMTGYRTPDPVAQLYAERPLGVRTGESRHDLPNALRSRRERIFSVAGDGGEFQLSDLPDEMRKLFKSTAYWNPKVLVGADGTASVEIELPDNTTTYRIMAVMVAEQARVGAAESKVVVRKPIMVQPVLPRFVYPDDTLAVEALVFNGTAEAGRVELVGELTGMEPSDGEIRGAATVKPGGQGSFKAKVRVTGRDEAMIRFAARLGEHTDAVELTLPILGAGTRRTAVASTSVVGNDAVTLSLPADHLPGSASLEVVTSTTALSELKDAVQYLMRYPNGCIEQTTSTAYPLVVLRDLLPEIGVEVNEADLKRFSEAGIKRILSFQTTSGGLSYWPGGNQPHAFATAFGLTALIAGKQRGYEVPDEALKGMGDYLEAALRRGDITESIPHGSMADGDTRALFVMTLGRLGRPQPAYVSTLWRERDKLTPFGLSFLAIAVKEMPGDHSLLEPILAEIRKAAEEDEDEAWYEGKRQGGWSFDSPLRTHAGALLAYASSGVSGSGDTTGKLLTGLLARRHGGMWGNTQENVFGIMGVHSLTQHTSGTGGEVPRMVLSVDGRQVEIDAMERVSDRVLRLKLGEDDLGLEDGKAKELVVELTNNGAAPIFLTARAVFEVALSDEVRRPTADGFSVQRSYETIDGKSLEGKTIPLGSLVRVRLRVETGEHRNYVAIDDKLPAGLEPLNTNLQTTETVAQGELTATVQRSLSVLSYSEIRDHRVAFFVDDMLPGEYEYSYVARATTPGSFLRPAGRTEAMYEPEVSGTTQIDTVHIK